MWEFIPCRPWFILINQAYFHDNVCLPLTMTVLLTHSLNIAFLKATADVPIQAGSSVPGKVRWIRGMCPLSLFIFVIQSTFVARTHGTHKACILTQMHVIFFVLRQHL